MATYVPNATDATQPTEDKYVGSAAAEFRALKTRVAAVAASVGTGSAATGGVAIVNQVMTSSTPDGRIGLPFTNAADWNLGAGTMHLECELVFNNYFAANPGGHFAIVERCDLDLISTYVRGQGIAIGNLLTAPYGTQINPGAQLESYNGGYVSPMGDNNLIAGAETNKALADGVRYKLLLDSVMTQALERRMRFALYAFDNTRLEWMLECDTGYVLDTAELTDMTKQGLIFGHVFASNLSPWSIDIQNIVVTWGPAPTDAAASSDKLSKNGGVVTGGLYVSGPVTVGGASLPLGTTIYTGMTHLGEANALTTWNNPQDMEGLSTIGVISATLGGAGATATNNAVEVATRPLYAYLSVLIALLKERKVI